jgi:hypothetical protein
MDSRAYSGRLFASPMVALARRCRTNGTSGGCRLNVGNLRDTGRSTSELVTISLHFV